MFFKKKGGQHVKKYRDLTPEEKAFICNGCGGKGGFIRPPHSKDFKEECNHHDWNYHIGCFPWERWKADFQLMIAMMKKVCKIKSRIEQARLFPWCFAYYIGVTICGWWFFYELGLIKEELKEKLIRKIKGLF